MHRLLAVLTLAACFSLAASPQQGDLRLSGLTSGQTLVVGLEPTIAESADLKEGGLASHCATAAPITWERPSYSGHSHALLSQAVHDQNDN
ncbi:hypothetical protein PoB_001691900 [Plakobranchus ocellatus]|uniref:Uncharacterized protein n=1 Tax=Plakobranchus ocellatus TaxID=259542 RepID=A0AAV3Z932_9GAST|nr:hypothetical protein PoB_001691900 [Plakobranchus ocellatus]